MEDDEIQTDTEVIETPDEVVVDEVEVDESVTPDEQPIEVDAWEELKSKGYDPAKLEKTFTRFTSELEAVKELERELAPIRQLKETIESDPKVYAALEKALAEVESEDDVESLKREVTGLKQQLQTEREIDELRKYAAEEGLPEIDERKLIEHAVRSNIGNLKSAYRDLHFDAIREAERQKALADAKRGQNAKVLPKAAKKDTATWDMASIAALTPEEFEKNRDSILAYYESKRG